VARAAGVSTDTLRHYEKKGLLRRPSRTPGGYRRYSPDTVQRVQLIQRALDIGFSLNDLARILQQRDQGVPPCKNVRDVVKDRLADLEDRLRDLAALRLELQQIVAEWDGRLSTTPDGQFARLLETLGSRPALDRERTRGKERRRHS
jgi:DNA-binding transcriptional MerR regulator